MIREDSESAGCGCKCAASGSACSGVGLGGLGVELSVLGVADGLSTVLPLSHPDLTEGTVSLPLSVSPLSCTPRLPSEEEGNEEALFHKHSWISRMHSLQSRNLMYSYSGVVSRGRIF